MFYKLEQEKLRLASIGKVKIKLYRELEGEVKTCSIIVKNSKYYAWLNDDQSNSNAETPILSRK
ncbi:28152_t:CDS:2, partial [Gigaspora margarita]